MKTDHSTSKGYPFDKIISQERFKFRLSPILDKRNYKVQITVDKQVYPDFAGISKIARLFAGRIVDFLLFRLFDYAEALHVAEQQIEDLLTDAPFIPEEFGFFKAVKPKDIMDNPAVVYISRFDDTKSLFRDNASDEHWVLVENNEGVFKSTQLRLPNHRIAYAAFLALGIQVEETTEKKVINSMLKNFSATYNDPKEGPVKIEKFSAREGEEKDIAKFILEKTMKRKGVNKEMIEVCEHGIAPRGEDI